MSAAVARAAAAVSILLLAAGPAVRTLAQDRPSEADLFGAPAVAAPPAAEEPKAAEPATEARPGADARGDALLGASSPRAASVISREREDWLKLGGQAYLRAATTWYRNQPPDAWAFTDPSILDLYLDARPNDRVRAFALGRLFATASGNGASFASQLGVPGSSSAAASGPTTRGVLDQLWLTFDVDHTVFVTAGKQHVKWGTGRFWNPTDYLHPTRRDPLTQYDDRTGVTMVKAHLPWEQRGWNFYGIALLEDAAGGLQPDGVTTTTVSTLGQVGGGARAEVVLGSLELAVDALAQKGHTPRFGLDGSFPLGDLDFKFELALRNGRDVPRWEKVPGSSSPDLISRYRLKSFDGLTPAAVVGAEWNWKYSDEDSLSIGAEFSYDASGYDSASIYPFLLAIPQLRSYLPSLVLPDARNPFTPFYLAKRYLGLYLYLPKPGSWNNTTFTVSALGSLVDGSGVVRIDHAVVLNTYLTLETYLAGHVGNEGGEFRFGAYVEPQYLGTNDKGTPISTPSVRIAPPVMDFGVALRVSL